MIKCLFLNDFIYGFVQFFDAFKWWLFIVDPVFGGQHKHIYARFWDKLNA